jgi:hypothetical protein
MPDIIAAATIEIGSMINVAISKTVASATYSPESSTITLQPKNTAATNTWNYNQDAFHVQDRSKTAHKMHDIIHSNIATAPVIPSSLVFGKFVGVYLPAEGVYPPPLTKDLYVEHSVFHFSE